MSVGCAFDFDQINFDGEITNSATSGNLNREETILFHIALNNDECERCYSLSGVNLTPQATGTPSQRRPVTVSSPHRQTDSVMTAC
jgi:hypothetical protein